MGAFADVVELATGAFKDVEIDRRCLGNAHRGGQLVHEMSGGEDKE
jgi:hypothetical protein